MKVIKVFVVILGGIICLALADAAAILAGGLTGADEWIVNLSELVVSGVIGVVGGRIMFRNWYLLALIPILYFGYIATIMHKIVFLYIGLNMPLALLTILTMGFLGASSRKQP